MQKIFYNARFLTLNDNFDECDAMLINDDNIVFVGESNEVLQMKTDETELVDLNKKIVVPTFFDVNIRLYSMIEQELKNAKKDNFIENLTEEDENYEKFCNFDIYAEEFDKLQNRLLNRGITTIQEEIKNVEEFIFWKKISESGRLKIDVIGYVDFLNNRKIMDDNCRSYRKYKNHFRLCGYYLNLDGDILEKKAWLKKAYPKEKGYKGFALLGFEQLGIIIKTALDEKKQLLVHADGNMAVEQFLICYEEQIKEKNIEDNFRPMILGCNFLNKKVLLKMKDLKITPVFKIDNIIHNEKRVKEVFGLIKSKHLIPISNIEKLGEEYLFATKENLQSNIIEEINYTIQSNSLINKCLKKEKKYDLNKALKTFIKTPAYYAFDLDQKGSFESGKKANFLVCDLNESEGCLFDIKVNQVYLDGCLVFENNKK